MSDHKCHDHCCGHDHNHEKTLGETEGIFGKTGEVPAVFSKPIPISLNREVTGAQLTQYLSQWVENIKKWVSENNYYIGHIKGYVDNGENSNLWFSTTGSDISIKESEDWQKSQGRYFTVNFTAIVFGCEERQLKDTILVELNQKLAKL